MIKRVLSLGGGVQSTDLLLRSLRGEFEHKPDYAIFSDTGSEPKAVYTYLEWFTRFVEQEFGFEVRVISAGNIYADTLEFVRGDSKRTDGIPFHIKSTNGHKAILKRQCTGYYKILPIRRHVKKDLPKKGNLELWLGISYDEMQRMKDPDVKWLIHHYPLVEKRIKRYDCIQNFKKYGLQVPVKSSCTICPYHSDDYWHWLYANEQDSFEAAVELDELIRYYPGITDAECFLHHSCRPLKEVIQDIIKRKEAGKRQLSMFPELIDECDGMCGT